VPAGFVELALEDQALDLVELALEDQALDRLRPNVEAERDFLFFEKFVTALLRASDPSACTGSRLPVLTRTGGKRTLQSPK